MAICRKPLGYRLLTFIPRFTLRKKWRTSVGELLNFDGSYGDWIDFTVVVSPSLIREVDITINGKTIGENYDIHDYLHEVFYNSLIQKM